MNIKENDYVKLKSTIHNIKPSYGKVISINQKTKIARVQWFGKSFVISGYHFTTLTLTEPEELI